MIFRFIILISFSLPYVGLPNFSLADTINTHASKVVSRVVTAQANTQVSSAITTPVSVKPMKMTTPSVNEIRITNFIKKLECNSNSPFANDCHKFINLCNQLNKITNTAQYYEQQLNTCIDVKEQRSSIKKKVSSLLDNVSKYFDTPADIARYSNNLINSRGQLANFNPEKFEQVAAQFSFHKKIVQLRREVSEYKNAPRRLINYVNNESQYLNSDIDELETMRQTFLDYKETLMTQEVIKDEKLSQSEQQSTNNKADDKNMNSSNSRGNSGNNSKKNKPDKKKTPSKKMEQVEKIKFKSGEASEVEEKKPSKGHKDQGSMSNYIWSLLALIAIIIIIYLLIRFETKRT